jgi:hypothetical protein
LPFQGNLQSGKINREICLGSIWQFSPVFVTPDPTEDYLLAAFIACETKDHMHWTFTSSA